MTALIPILVIASVSLLTSFLCSMLEACMYSVTRSRIETLVHQGDKRGLRLKHIRAHIDEAIAAILIVNTIANSAGAAWAGAMVGARFDSAAVGVFSGLFTAAVLFFAEIVPKSLGVRFAPTLAPMLALPLRIMVWLLWPLIRLSLLVTRMWSRRRKRPDGTEEDIISLARLVQSQGEIRSHEARWVTNALRLDSVTAYDLMTPKPVVARVSEDLKVGKARIHHDHWRFSRLPVCRADDPDTIVGVVHRRRVFDALARDDFNRTIHDLMQRPDSVPQTMPAHRLLERFLDRREHLSCVFDDDGEFAGVVTLEDVLECLLGEEIVDETDLHEDMQELAKRRKDTLLRRSTDLQDEDGRGGS